MGIEHCCKNYNGDVANGVELFESYGGDNETKNDIADNDNDDNKTENDDEEIACEGMGLGQDSCPEL